MKGIGRKQITLMKLFQEHNEEFQKRVSVDRVQATLDHYVRTYELLEIFLREKYDTEDVTLRSLSLTYIDAFDLFLRQDRLMAQHTISGHLINLKKIVRRAVSQGTLKRDPFVTFVPEQPERKCRHLKAEELGRLMNVHIDSKKPSPHKGYVYLFDLHRPGLCRFVQPVAGTPENRGRRQFMDKDKPAEDKNRV